MCRVLIFIVALPDSELHCRDNQQAQVHAAALPMTASRANRHSTPPRTHTMPQTFLACIMVGDSGGVSWSPCEHFAAGIFTFRSDRRWWASHRPFPERRARGETGVERGPDLEPNGWAELRAALLAQNPSRWLGGAARRLWRMVRVVLRCRQARLSRHKS